MIPSVKSVGPLLAAHTAKAEQVQQAGREFEAIFVRTILRSSPVGQGSGQYGELALDGVAKAVTSGKGLGLADMLARAMAHEPERAAGVRPQAPAQGDKPLTVRGG